MEKQDYAGVYGTHALEVLFSGDETETEERKSEKERLTKLLPAASVIVSGRCAPKPNLCRFSGRVSREAGSLDGER